MEKIRVLRILARLNIGGPAIHTVILTYALNPERFTTQLVIGVEQKDEGNMLDYAAQKGVVPLVIPELGRELSFKNDVITLYKLYKVIRRFKPHIVHTHTAKAGTVGRLAARLAGVPIIVHTFHGHIFQGYFGKLKTRFFLEDERFIAGFTDRIVTVSELQRKDIIGYRIGTPGKIVVISPGLELDQYLTCYQLKGALRAELGLELETPLVGIVGRLVPIKGHRYFLEAATQIVAQCPRTHFIVVGDGELREYLKEMAQTLKLADRVHFLGWRRDLTKIYADLDVLTISSISEGMPLCLVEAMASQRPVVSFNVGGIADLLVHGQSGLLVKQGDVQALATSIIELLQNPQKAEEMGAFAQRLVYPRFSSERLVGDMEELYLELLKEKGIWQ